jgi:hypothetical protein
MSFLANIRAIVIRILNVVGNGVRSLVEWISWTFNKFIDFFGIIRSIVIRLFKVVGNGVRSLVEWISWTFNKFIDFFEISGSIIIVVLLLGGGALVWAWQTAQLQSFVAVIASGTAVVFAAVAGFTANILARWLLIAVAGVFTMWFSWFSVADLTGQLKEATDLASARQERLQLVLDDLANNYFNQLPGDEKRKAVAIVGHDILRKRFREIILKHQQPFHSAEFDANRDMIYLLSKLVDENRNGHILYIKGEIERALNHPDVGGQRFHDYLEFENYVTRNGKLGTEQCKNPDGLCRERTAWIFNLFARDLLQKGRSLKAAGAPEAVYKEKFNEALKHVCSAIELYGNDGFTQVPTTRTVERSLHEELGKAIPTTKPGPGVCL